MSSSHLGDDPRSFSVQEKQLVRSGVECTVWLSGKINQDLDFAGGVDCKTTGAKILFPTMIIIII